MANNEPSTSLKRYTSSRCPASRFPSDVLKYARQDASPIMALKLMQSHSYFQLQELPFFVMKKLCLNYYSDEIKWQYEALDNKWHYHNDIQSYIDFPEEIGISEELTLAIKFIPFSSISSKIGICNVKKLTLWYQNIVIDDLRSLITGNKNLKVLECQTSTVFHSYHWLTAAAIEEVVKLVPKIETFLFDG